jgi:hypothetical protein
VLVPSPVMCGGRPCVKCWLAMATIAVGCKSCVWPVGATITGLLAMMWFARLGPDQLCGLDTRDRWKVLPPRRPTDRHHAISTSATVTPYGVFLSALTFQSRASAAAITHRRATYPVTAHASARFDGQFELKLATRSTAC